MIKYVLGNERHSTPDAQKEGEEKKQPTKLKENTIEYVLLVHVCIVNIRTNGFFSYSSFFNDIWEPMCSSCIRYLYPLLSSQTTHREEFEQKFIVIPIPLRSITSFHHLWNLEYNLNVRDNKNRVWHNDANIRKLMRAEHTRASTYKTFTFCKCSSCW